MTGEDETKRPGWERPVQMAAGFLLWGYLLGWVEIDWLTASARQLAFLGGQYLAAIYLITGLTFKQTMEMLGGISGLITAWRSKA